MCFGPEQLYDSVGVACVVSYSSFGEQSAVVIGPKMIHGFKWSLNPWFSMPVIKMICLIQLEGFMGSYNPMMTGNKLYPWTQVSLSVRPEFRPAKGISHLIT